jgi:hypothetical protein
MGVAAGLLGTHVGQRAECHSGGRQGGEAFVSGGTGDAEISEQGLTPRHEDVLGLDVAVNDAARVGVVERVADLAGDAGYLGEGERLLTLETSAQGLALDVRHHEEEITVGIAGVVQWQDVGMLQTRDELNLPREAVDADLGGEGRVEDLDRDLAGVLAVVSQKDRGHAAASYFAQQLVTAREDLFASGAQLCHLRERR